MAHGLGAATLLLSFVLLCRRGWHNKVSAYAAQGWVVAAAVAWQGWLQGDAGYLAVALAGGLIRGMGLPRLMRRGAAADMAAEMGGGGPLVALALGLGVVAVAAMLTRTMPDADRGGMAVTLSVIGIGMLLLVAERTVLGLLAVENGAALLAAGLPGSPLLTLGGLTMAGCLVLIRPGGRA